MLRNKTGNYKLLHMDLSIVILNYKSKGLLKQCLRGIELVKPQLEYEIIVVDNASKDDSVDMVKNEFLNQPRQNIKIIVAPENRGYAVGNNLGIREAQGKYIIILNPDIIVLSDIFTPMVNYMEQHPKLGLAAPKLLNPDGSLQMSCLQFPRTITPIYRRTPLGKLGFAKKYLRRYLMMDWDHCENRAVDWVLGACFMFRKSALDKVGLLDESFFMYFDDIDWCRRFWEAGYQIHYLASVETVHYHKRESAESPGLKGLSSYATRLHIKSWVKYTLKHLGKPYPNNK